MSHVCMHLILQKFRLSLRIFAVLILSALSRYVCNHETYYHLIMKYTNSCTLLNMHSKVPCQSLWLVTGCGFYTGCPLPQSVIWFVIWSLALFKVLSCIVQTLIVKLALKQLNDSLKQFIFQIYILHVKLFMHFCLEMYTSCSCLLLSILYC